MLTITHLPFHGDQIDTLRDEEGAWVSLPRCCAHLGIAPENQRKKLRSKPWARMKSEKVTTGGGSQTVTLIHADSLPMWLATIEPSRVVEAARPILEAYQMEAAKTLADYWNRGIALNPNATDEQKDAAVDQVNAWFSARRLGIDTRKEFVSMVNTIGLGGKYPDAYQRSTNDLYTRLFNVTQGMRHEAVAALVAEKGHKTYVDPEGKRRAYNFRDTLSVEDLSRLEDAERRIESVATALHNEGLDPDRAYGKARDQVLAKMGITTPF